MNVFDEITKNSSFQSTPLGKSAEQGRKTDDFGDFPIEREAPVKDQQIKTQATGELIFVDGQMIKKPVKTNFGKKGAYEYIKAKRNWRDNLNRRCTIVGDYTPVFNNQNTESSTPVNVSTVKLVDGKKYGVTYEIQKWDNWHMSVNPTVEVVEVQQTKLDDDVEFRRISQKYSRYATRVIGTEEFERQGTLDQSYSHKEDKAVMTWLDKFHMETIDLLPIEVHQKHILNQVTLVTEIYDDGTYFKAYPQVEVKKVGQMKLELF